MKKISTINTLLVFLVIIGTVFANVNAIVSIMPINIVERDVERVDNKTTISDINEFDVKTLTEIADYISIQAAQNNFEISAMVYSSGLLFESDNSLIIIGHGHFSSNDQYFIADYSTNRISKMAENKEVVALLACYSNNIGLENDLQLTYADTIDLISAIQDLFNLLSWTESSQLNPIKNIRLFDLDPGPGGYVEAVYLMNGVRYAHSRNKVWNLYSGPARANLAAYMQNNKYTLVELTFSGIFAVEQGRNTGIYELEYHKVTYDTWLTIEGDTKTYLKITNVKHNGVRKRTMNRLIKLDKVNALLEANFTGAGLIGSLDHLGDIFLAIGIALLTSSTLLIIAAKTATSLAAAVTAALIKLAAVALWFAVACFAIALMLAISCVILQLCWI